MKPKQYLTLKMSSKARTNVPIVLLEQLASCIANVVQKHKSLNLQKHSKFVIP